MQSIASFKVHPQSGSWYGEILFVEVWILLILLSAFSTFTPVLFLISNSKAHWPAVWLFRL